MRNDHTGLLNVDEACEKITTATTSMIERGSFEYMVVES
jgi:hypothetical protein